MVTPILRTSLSMRVMSIFSMDYNYLKNNSFILMSDKDYKFVLKFKSYDKKIISGHVFKIINVSGDIIDFKEFQYKTSEFFWNKFFEKTIIEKVINDKDFLDYECRNENFNNSKIYYRIQKYNENKQPSRKIK